MSAKLTIFVPLPNEWDGKVMPARPLVYPGPDGALEVDPRKVFVAKLWDATVHSVTSVEEVAQVLRTSPPPCVAVHGTLIDPATTKKIAKKHASEPRTLKDGGMRVCFVDIDGIGFPEGHDWPVDPEWPARYCRSLLPHAFHEAKCFWYFTGSMGFKEGIRLRLVFLFDQDVPIADVKYWLANSPVDRSLYTPSHFAFFNAPEIAPGAEDPLPIRDGILDGTPLVRVPLGDIAALKDIHSNAATRSKTRAHAGGMKGGAVLWTDYLKHLGKDVYDRGHYEPVGEAIRHYWIARPDNEARDFDECISTVLSWLHAYKPSDESASKKKSQRIADAPNWCRFWMGVWQQIQSARKARRENAPELFPVEGGTLAEAEAQMAAAVDATFADVRYTASERKRLRECPTVKRAVEKIERQRQFFEGGEGARKLRLTGRARSPEGEGEPEEYMVPCASGTGERKLPADLELTNDETGALSDNFEEVIHARRPVVMKATPGAGKTRGNLKAIAALVRDGVVPAEGETCFAIPTHKKAEEVCPDLQAELAAAGVSGAVEIYRGISQKRDDVSVCLDFQRAKAGLDAGVPIDDICGHGENRCVFFDQCEYRKQRTRRPATWIVTHAHLHSTLPPGVRDPLLLIVDEQLERDFEPEVISLALLTEAAGLFDRMGIKKPAAELRALDRLFCDLPDGEPGSAEHFSRGLDIRKVAGLMKKIDALRPRAADAFDATKTGGEALAKIAETNSRIRKLKALLEGVTLAARGQAGRLRIETTGGQRVAKVWLPGGLHSDWQNAKIVNLDATANELILRNDYGEHVETVVDARVEKPASVHVVQVAFQENGKLVGARTWLGGKDGWDRSHGVEQVIRAFATNVYQALGRKIELGVVGPKGLIAELEKAWLPDSIANTEFAHFGALRGLNTMEHADAVVVVGMNLPSQEAIENEIRGRWGEIPDANKETPEAAFVCARGEVRALYERPGKAGVLMRHHVMAEAAQALGRSRWVRRDPAHPLWVLLINHVPHDIAVDKTLTWEDALGKVFTSDWAEAFGGIVVRSPPLRGLVDPFIRSRKGRREGESEKDYIKREAGRQKKRRQRGEKAAWPLIGEKGTSALHKVHCKGNVPISGVEGTLTPDTIADPFAAWSRAVVSHPLCRNKIHARIAPEIGRAKDDAEAALRRRDERFSVREFEPVSQPPALLETVDKLDLDPTSQPTPSIETVDEMGGNRLLALADEHGLTFTPDDILASASLSRAERRRLKRHRLYGRAVADTISEHRYLLSIAMELGPERYEKAWQDAVRRKLVA
jgi:hypothetical protein